MGKLQDKVAIITGATGGIGSAAATLFSREGALLVLADRDENQLREVAATCDPDRTCWVVADNRDVESLAYVVETATYEFGRLQVVFANAGLEGKMRPFLEIPLEAYDEVWDVNVRGTIALLQRAVPAMLTTGGSIVITGSMASVLSIPGISPYAVSKTALLGLVRTLAIELGASGIRVNLLAPGGIDNRMLHSLMDQLSSGRVEAMRPSLTDLVPMKRFGTSEEMAKAALFLASDDSSYCSGTVLLADGGFSAG